MVLTFSLIFFCEITNALILHFGLLFSLTQDKDENKSNKSGEKKRRFSFFGKKKKDEKPKGSDEEAENENNEVIDLGQSDLDSDTEVKSVKVLA